MKSGITNENMIDSNSPNQESQIAMQKALTENMNMPNGSQRLLQYNIKAPAAPEGHQNPLRVVYSQVITFIIYYFTIF